ncbi:unnamed protein product [Mytilus coruscus]|uniref:Uncharacterized protein n=1 Tax=Mytilus coruscus TaxID=42192 RepID=A0A6J8CT40_MYTCO|nr:unnamed protein product [Mytilus coruscus]
MEVSDVPVKIISPAQAVVEQASTEIDHKTYAKKGIKRKRKSKSIRRDMKPKVWVISKEIPGIFQNFQLGQIGLSVNGIPVNGIPVNGGPLQLSYNNTTGYTVVLSNLLMTTRKWLNDEAIEISRDDIPGGCALYAFDTTPDLDGNIYLSLKKQGSLRIDAAFDVALPHTVNSIILAERQG